MWICIYWKNIEERHNIWFFFFFSTCVCALFVCVICSGQAGLLLLTVLLGEYVGGNLFFDQKWSDVKMIQEKKGCSRLCLNTSNINPPVCPTCLLTPSPVVFPIFNLSPPLPWHFPHQFSSPLSKKSCCMLQSEETKPLNWLDIASDRAVLGW